MKCPCPVRISTVFILIFAFLSTPCIGAEASRSGTGAAPVERNMSMIQILKLASVPHPYDSHLRKMVLNSMEYGTRWYKYRDIEDGRRYVGHDACRPCHYDRNRTWMETKMATSIKKLADFKGGIFLNDPRCISCHTTGFDPGRNNGGFDEGLALLANVQCEACHGAGSLMVERMNRQYIIRTTDAGLCGRCHSERYGVGLCFPEYDEWKVSRHSRSLETLRASEQAEDKCLECHSVDAIVPPSNYQLRVDNASYGVTCEACHDSMVRTFPELPDNNQLRLPKMELCQWCHSERVKVAGDLPHAPQAELFQGRGGAEFPGEDYRNGPMNADIERGCLTCHALSDRSKVPSYQGHTFLPNILACRRCHPDIDSFNRRNVQGEIRNLLLKLEGKLKEYPPSGKDGKFYRMALYNFNFVRKDRSLGIHNTDYARKLLGDSIRFLSKDLPGPE